MSAEHQRPGSPVWHSLRDDPVCRLTGVVLVLLAVPYAVPVVSSAVLATLSSRYFDIILTGLPIVAILHRLDRVEHPEERRFWRHLATGLWHLADRGDCHRRCITVWPAGRNLPQ